MERELFDFIDRVATSIMTVVLSLFLGIFRNYTFYYIVYMDSLFSNDLRQMPMTNYVNLNIFQNIEGIILLSISVISTLLSLIPAIKFLKWTNEEVSKEDLGLNFVLALLIQLITLFL
ncbi:MAG: hypothetical protein RXQ99_09160 [Acidianus sp.]|uniref:hypothetical protein n=1 Tax=Acidianus sp. TaxID=1872104 RepID=UPI003979BB85